MTTDKLGQVLSEIKAEQGGEPKEVWLTFQDIETGDVKEICDFLLENKSVQRINLNGISTLDGALVKYCIGNSIGDKGAQELSKVLKELPLLCDLNLAGNGIGDIGVEAIAACLVDNRNLASLCLLSNSITCKGAQALADALLKNSYLQCLYLYLNRIKDNGCEKLSIAIAKHPHLSKVWMDHNQISEEAAKSAIKTIMNQNKSLLEFEITAGSQVLTPSEQLPLKLFLHKNQTLREKKTKSAVLLIKRRTGLLRINLKLPIELIQQILFAGIYDFDDREKVILGTILLNRAYIGKFLPVKPSKNQSKAVSSICAYELLRQCESLFLKYEFGK